MSFHREKYVAAGGPDGGDGGRGGDVVLVVDPHMSTLMDFRYKHKYAAENGQDGGGKRCRGRDGEPLRIKVPRGTVVRDAERDVVIGDLSEDDSTFVVAKGGKGGYGNYQFASATRQTPNFAKPGKAGRQRDIILELKLIADVGLIGFPNVGKSTLLSVLTNARPKIANYHFTTLAPNLGILNAYDTGIVLADIPGLIEGAHQGTGLGHSFLRHIERTRMLLHIVDISGIEGRSPVEDFDTINSELFTYSDAMRDKPQIVIGNKADLSEENVEAFAIEMQKRGYTFIPISAATRQGISELIEALYHTVKDLPGTEIVVHQDVEEVAKEDYTITIEDGVYMITGRWADELLEGVNIYDDQGLAYFQRALKMHGVIDKLEQMGINEKDTVNFCDIEFLYER